MFAHSTLCLLALERAHSYAAVGLGSVWRSAVVAIDWFEMAAKAGLVLGNDPILLTVTASGVTSGFDVVEHFYVVAVDAYTYLWLEACEGVDTAQMRLLAGCQLQQHATTS